MRDRFVAASTIGGIAAALVASLASIDTAEASYGVYVGKNLTNDGSVFLAGYGDEPSSHWLVVEPARDHPPTARIRVGVTENLLGLGKDKRRVEGELFFIPQAPHTARNIRIDYSAYRGFPGPLTNGGLNEHKVAARDIWSPSRKELVAMTPSKQRGLNYSDLSRNAVQRARTAREAVEIVGELIEKHGYATYGGNSHLFADPNEGWILIELAGGKGLWVAERLGPDDIRVSRPGYIGEIPVDFKKNPNYMGSDNLVSFAVKQGWYDPKSKEPFNVHEIYAKRDGRMREPVVALIEKRLRKRAGSITLQDIIEVLRTPEVSRDSAGYGQIAHLRADAPSELGVLWVTLSSPVTAPFVPIYLGVQSIPEEYGWHRYLTTGEASRFLDADRMGLASTRSAFHIFKRLYYLTCSHPQKFLPEVVEALNAFEKRLIDEQAALEESALSLYRTGRAELAQKLLTKRFHFRAQNAMDLAVALAQSIEARTKVLFGIRTPAGLEDSGRIHCTAEFAEEHLGKKERGDRKRLDLRAGGEVGNPAPQETSFASQRSSAEKKRGGGGCAGSKAPLWLTILLAVIAAFLGATVMIQRRRG
jgi:dipeptidase